MAAYTSNHKYRPARPVTVERFDPEVRYTFDDFDEFLPVEPEPERRQQAHNGHGRRPTKTDTDALIRRFEKYLATVPGAIEGAGGDSHTFKTACAGVID